jgi:hypothetical protein
MFLIVKRVETIGRLKGIKVGALPAAVQTRLRRALGARGGKR